MRRRAATALLAMSLLSLGVTATGASAAGAHDTGARDAAPRPGPAPGGLVSQDLATRGQGFPVYRIPALTTSARGTLIAAYDGRPTLADVPSNIALVVRRSTDGGATWTRQSVVRAEAAPKGFGDPSLLTDRTTGRIFLFHAASVNRGFHDSATGNNDNDPDILHTDYSFSDDDGVTWSHRRITSAVKDPAWGGIFAASGEGIQLRHGRYQGRLIQQYVLRHGGGNYAASVYSDDHGTTWQAGTPVGPGADENKTAELSDGTVMLNSRAAPHRLVAYSGDGGVTYTPLQPDTLLRDPGNNGSLVRYAPDAPASDPRSAWLLFSNTDDTGIRRNLTVRMSCDDGQTWPVSKVVVPGSAAYSTLTPLPGGRVGLLYERAGYQHITYSSFGLDWLGGVCAPVTLTVPGTARAGGTADVTVRVVNQSGRRLPAGTVRLGLPAGWSAHPAAVPALGPGQSADVAVPVTIARTATGGVPVTATYRNGDRSSSGTGTLTVTPDPSAPAAPGLSVVPVLDNVAEGGGPGLPGDVLSYAIRVTNTGNTALTDVTVTGAMDNLAACHHSSLAAGRSYVCKGSTSGRVTLTRADARRGTHTPVLTVTGLAPDGTRTAATGRGERTRLR